MCLVAFRFEQIGTNPGWGSDSELRVRLVLWNYFKPSSNFLTDRSNGMLLLMNLFVICLCHFYTAMFVPCSLVVTCWEVVFSCVCHFHMRCAGSGVVLDYIDSWSLPSFLIHSSLHWIHKRKRSFIALQSHIMYEIVTLWASSWTGTDVAEGI